MLFGALRATVMRSPGADRTRREEVLVYSYLTFLLTSPLYRLFDPQQHFAIEATLVQIRNFDVIAPYSTNAPRR